MDLQAWLDGANGQFVTALMIFVRFGALLFTAPLVSGRQVPVQVRLGLSGALALVLTPITAAAPVQGIPVLIVGLAKEAGVGLLLGWTASLIFGAVQMAGEWLDLQSGFQASQLLNPAFDTHNALLGHFYYLVAGLVFLGTGGYALVIRAAASSLIVSPPGALRLSLGDPGDWSTLLMQVLWIAIQLAAPVAAALFLAEIAMGMANRALPQMNVMVLSMPVRAALALLVLVLSLPIAVRVIGSVVNRLGAGLMQILAGG